MSAARRPRKRPASNEDMREKQLVSQAMNLAEKQLLDGTASSQIITHFLKVGSTREKLEQDRLRGEVKLIDKKIDALEAQQNLDVAYKEALDAMRSYSGSPPPEEEVFYD